MNQAEKKAKDGDKRWGHPSNKKMKDGDIHQTKKRWGHPSTGQKDHQR
jgi:hypothetical protein